MSEETALTESLFPDSEGRAAVDDSELVIAFVAAVGVNLALAEDAVQKRLQDIGYEVVRIRVTRDVFPKLDNRATNKFANDFDRIKTMMDVGTDARRKYGNEIIARGIAAEILRKRAAAAPKRRIAYLVHSLKHPNEVRCLRQIYARGFYLIGVHSPPESRRQYLGKLKGIGGPEAKRLMTRDRQEGATYGQQLVDTFHLSDFFAGWEEAEDTKVKDRSIQLLHNSLYRFVEIVFGHPHRTPTFGEYAMFLAFSSALRSADLSRQVGAVIARAGEILAMGANDCSRSGGGLYWPTLDFAKLTFEDFQRGRDWTRSVDTNKKEQIELVTEIINIVGSDVTDEIWRCFHEANVPPEIVSGLQKTLRKKLQDTLLKDSRINDLTEFGRVVHAEMEALLSCARKGISTLGATVYSTTFPCHNCAKHIIAAGISRVVFIEPYLKSRALAFHDEAIEIGYPVLSQQDEATQAVANAKVRFEPFFGVGPRRFFDLFSMEIGVGYALIRKERPGGDVKPWTARNATVRISMPRESYLDEELKAVQTFEAAVGGNRAATGIPESKVSQISKQRASHRSNRSHASKKHRKKKRGHKAKK